MKRNVLTVLLISAIYFTFISFCLADTTVLRRTLLPRDYPVIGPLPAGVSGPEYYPEGEWLVPLVPRDYPVIGPLGDGIQGPEYYPVPEPDFVPTVTAVALFGMFRLWLLGRRMR